MSEDNIDKLLRDKLSGKAYPYDDAYWQSAQSYIQQQKQSRGGISWSVLALIGVFIALSGAAGTWLWLKPSSMAEEKTEKLPTLRPTEMPSVQSEKGTVNSQIEHSSKSRVGYPEQAIKERKSELSNRDQTASAYNAPNGKKAHPTVNNTSISSHQQFNKQSFKSSRNPYSAESTNPFSNHTIKQDGTPSIPHDTREERSLFDALTMEPKETKGLKHSKQGVAQLNQRFETSSPSLIGYGIFTNAFFMGAQENSGYAFENYREMAIGAFAQYQVSARWTIEGGLGYNSQRFNLQQEITSLTERTASTVTNHPEWQVTEQTETVYDMEFSGGVPVHFSSQQVTVYDSTLVDNFDTTYQTVTDTNHQRWSGNYTVNYIQLPLTVAYHYPINRWDVFASAGVIPHVRSGVQLRGQEGTLDQPNPFREFSIDGTLGIGFQWDFTENWRIGVTGASRFALSRPYTITPNGFTRWGIQSHLMYRF